MRLSCSARGTPGAGGIRCDIFSSRLIKDGYKNLYTLEGGIQNYLCQEGNEHWNGHLFVFDNR